MKLTQNFKLQELVSKKVYEEYEDKSVRFLDPALINLIQTLRDRYGLVTINNWETGGERQYSGLRYLHEPHWSITSQHSFGRAADLVFKNITPDEFQQDLLDNLDSYPTIGGFGRYQEFTHIDVRFKLNNQITKWRK